MKSVRRLILGILPMLSISAAALAEEPFTLHSFRRVQLSDQFFCEGANDGDFNRD